ncbi:G2 and S phase-expressed protein 1 [Trichechus manatus latirostris]|uniref:G2 and S phase-expressed protein 1 n=1 Tax=Trichechus manatus latirostris TaxID=127582 RepID=A0A2Y9DTL3_TRIMA|nr:G2 and S phase-expressed protein 1 [Trichechus manatus latirostris]
MGLLGRRTPRPPESLGFRYPRVLSSRPVTPGAPAWWTPSCAVFLPPGGMLRFGAAAGDFLTALSMDGGDRSEGPAASPAGQAKTDARKKDDVLLLADETFDFDLSLSSSSANEDDEVFFGPAGHEDRRVAASVELNNPIPEEPLLAACGSRFPWSPLTGEKFAEVYKEAHLLALQIEGNSKNKATDAKKPGGPGDQDVEIFVQESKLKANIFEKGSEMKKSPTSLKRETYYLSESPLTGPPCSGLQPPSGLALHPGPAEAGLPRTREPHPSSRSSLAVEPSAVHPPSQAVTQKKIVSRLQQPRASSVRGKSILSAVEKPKKEIPASPCRTKLLNDKESHREVLPEKSRVAVDAVTVPAGGSHLVPGKRVRPVPNKLGLRRTLLKPPGRTGSLARKSSSSGSVSGVTSRMGTSSAGGQAQSGELVSVPADGSRAVSNRTLSRLGPPTQQQPWRSGPADASCEHTKLADVAEFTAEQPERPSTASFTQPQTPDNAGLRLDCTFSLPRSSQLNTTGSTRRRDSYRNSKTKIVPTPTNQFKIPKFSTGESPFSATPQHPREQRPQSCASAGRVVHSTPVRHWSGPTSQSLLPSARTPVSTKRLLAVPTPASHRLSGLPLMTLRTMPRALASPWCASARRLSSEPKKRSGARNQPTTESSTKGTSRPSDPSSDSFSPPSAVPQALNFSPEKRDFTFSKNITEATLTEAKTTGNTPLNEALLVDTQLNQLTIAPKAESGPLADPLLIDFCNTPEANGGQLLLKPSVALESESKPLIDLMINTPDMNKDVALKPLQVVGQLIDLASPLIQLSPAADKENVDSPLLKF